MVWQCVFVWLTGHPAAPPAGGGAAVGNQENTNVPHDGCAIVAGENATMAVASAILLILSRPTDLSLSLCEIEIAYRRLITA